MAVKKVALPKIIQFDWDEGNLHKSRLKHYVEPTECEEVFFNDPLLTSPDPAHSSTESRFISLGQTNRNRKLLVAFTIRKQKIRIISARNQSKKERTLYEKS